MGDASSLTGGGFHLFTFDFLFTSTSTLLLDVDSLPDYDRRDVSDYKVKRGMEDDDEKLVRDVMDLVGWREEDMSEGDDDELLTQIRQSLTLVDEDGSFNDDSLEDDDGSVSNPVICASYAKYFPRNDVSICLARLREWGKEERRVKENEKRRWRSLHPSSSSCKKVLDEKGQVQPLDAAQCSVIFMDERAKEESK